MFCFEHETRHFAVVADGLVEGGESKLIGSRVVHATDIHNHAYFSCLSAHCCAEDWKFAIFALSCSQNEFRRTRQLVAAVVALLGMG